MTISMIQSALKMTAAITDTKSVPNTVQQRVAQAWQASPGGASPTTEKKEPGLQLSTKEQAAIDEFIEKMRTTDMKKKEEKRELFSMLNKKLISLSSAERVSFMTGLSVTIKDSEVPGDETLLKEKFNPVYSLYLANDMFLTQMKEEIFSKMGKVPNEDDDDSNEF
ncbi:hypothetical protein [Yersinia proxima]|uniref:Uncharacterized protein n=1 Tax=Yersinia proxima TaxID=2890316 RepID=A0ABW9EYW1_9GAMM|nr:hypothetical protein [Yersinia proxima]